MPRVTFFLKPLPPFRLDLTVWTLRRRAGNTVDRWDGKTYRRVLALGADTVEVAISQTGTRLQVDVEGARDASFRAPVRAVLERLLGLRVDLASFFVLADRDRRLAALVERFRGAKPPRFPTIFEALINAISCQQLSLTVGILLLNRLAEAYGLPFSGTAGPGHAFPRPQELGDASPTILRSLGYSGGKARAIIELAQLVMAGRLQLERLAEMDDRKAIERLLELRGVGRWTAEYVLLRGLGRLAVFPGDDVGARKRLGRWIGARGPLDYEGVRRITRRWPAHAGLVYFHLLLAGLADAGVLG